MAGSGQTLPRILVDGRECGQVGVLDRGLSYGDGVFRTVRISSGQPRWWPEHLARLAEDCAGLGLTMPEPAELEQDLAALAPLPEFGVLRLTVTRGQGPRGYRMPESVRCTRILACWPEDSPIASQDGLYLRVCQLRLGYQPALAGIKHLNRLENVLARAEWTDAGIDEGILLDQDDRVVSGVMSNLFIWRDGCLQTPRLTLCGVAGVARRLLMRRAAQAGFRVEEGDFDLVAVLDAEEVVLTNSLMGVRRAGRLGDRRWPVPVISTLLARLLDD